MNVSQVKNNCLFYLNLFRVIPVTIPFLLSDSKDSVKSDLNLLVDKGCIKKTNYISLCRVLFSDKYYRTVYYHKIGNLSKMFRFLLPCCDTFVISSNVKLGKSIFCAHPFSTYINAHSIGDYFSFRNNITIGNKSDDRYDEIPVIGNHVSVGANSVIIGKINIGNNVIIGAGSVVVHSIPDNSVVAGNPAHIINKKKQN